MKRFLLLIAALVVTALLASDANAQLLRGRRGGCDSGGGCNVGSSGCNVGSSQGCNISQNVTAARAADLIQQPALPPAANAGVSRRLPTPFEVKARGFDVKPVRGGYSDASVLAFASPVKQTPLKPERYIAARPEASSKLVASR